MGISELRKEVIRLEIELTMLKSETGFSESERSK
jgi:hypothetical protein